MADFDHHNVDSNDEIDYDFFDNENINKSEKDDEGVINSRKSDIQRDSIDFKKVSKDENSLHNSGTVDVSSSEELDGISSSSSQISEQNSSNHSSLSIEKSKSSHKSKKSSSNKMSASPQSSPRRSPSESDVTTVSSLDSEPKIKNRSRSQTRQEKNKDLTVIDNPEDVDRVQPEAILRAMIRIHEERRAMRHLRPKWVDPNTKDYSVSGLTAKMNLVPQRIVSAQRKNIRDNPFYMNFNKAAHRPYHTAINREKELDRIEKENRAIYERIKKVQPSPGITKQELLREYSKTNRFSLPYNSSPYAASLSSYQTMTASHSRSSSQARRTHSSASIRQSKSETDPTLVSRKYSGSRVMSASSLTSNGTRPHSTVSDQRRVVKKSRY